MWRSLQFATGRIRRGGLAILKFATCKVAPL
jgi:hypothetical protein